MSSTSPPELQRIKIARVSGNLTVLRIRLQEAQGHFALERKMQSYGNTNLVIMPLEFLNLPLTQ